MKKLLLGLTAVFALSVAAPAYASDDAAAEKPAKAAKKAKKAPKKDAEKAEKKDAEK